jgi:hypothetical protein
LPRTPELERDVSKVVYEVVEHDGGWAYRVGKVLSEPFPTHAEAHRAAELAAERQQLAGSTDGIEYEDAKYVWHQEVADGGDRPETEVDDPVEPKPAK